MITCQFENNDKTSLRHITVGVVVVKDGQIMLGLRNDVKGRIILEVGKWALLGGYLDRDENLDAGVRREVLEESGWEITNLRLLRINDNPDRPKEDRQNVDFVFVADAVRDTGKRDEEMSETRWFDLESLPEDKTIAFDHADNIKLYKRYLQNSFAIPVIG